MNSTDSDDSEFEAYHFYLRQLRQALKRDDVPKETKKSAMQLINAWGLYYISDDDFVEMANKLLKQMETKPKIKEEEDLPEEQPQIEVYPCDSTYFDPYDDLAEEWLDNTDKAQAYKWRRDADWVEGGPTYHRAGLKRDKTEFWNRPLTRWHRHHKERRQQRERKAAKRRQNDNQLQM